MKVIIVIVLLKLLKTRTSSKVLRDVILADYFGITEVNTFNSTIRRL